MSPGKNNRFFDVSEQTLKLQNRAEKDFSKLASLVDETLNNLVELMTEAEALVVKDKHSFESRFKIMSGRYKLLMAIGGSEVELHEAVEEAKTCTPPPVPLPCLSELLLLTALKTSISSIGSEPGVVDQLSLSRSFDGWHGKQQPVAVLLNACKSSMLGFTAAQKQQVREIETERKKAEAKAKSKAKAKSVAAKANSRGFKNPSSIYNIFELELTSLDEIPEAPSLDKVMNVELPFVLKPAGFVTELASKNPCRLNLLVFKAGLQRASEGRQQSSLQKAESVRQEILKNVVDSKDLVLDDEAILNEVLCFGSKRGSEHIGLDPTCMFVAKSIMTPSSSVCFILCSLAKAFAHLTAKAIAASPTVVDVKKWLKALSQEQLDEAASEHMIYHGIVQSDEVLVVPAGWFLAEKTMCQVVCGIQVSFARRCPSSVDSLKALVGLANMSSASSEDYS